MPTAPHIELLDRLMSALVGGVYSVKLPVVGVAGDGTKVEGATRDSWRGDIDRRWGLGLGL